MNNIVITAINSVRINVCIVLIFLIASQLSSGQDFERKTFDYSQFPEDMDVRCYDPTIEELNAVLKMIDNLQSKKSAILAKDIFEKTENCPMVFEIYAWALFRSGEWMESMSIIDSAITIFGADPDLILRRGYMNLEMAELGVGVRNIDGSGVYLGRNQRLNYEDSIFKRQNYLSALNDLKHIADNYHSRYQEIHAIGYIYQKLQEYENSTAYFSRLLKIEDFTDEVTFLIIDNHIGQKKYSEAKASLKILEKKYPKDTDIQKKLSEVYELMGDKERSDISKSKARFYSWVPAYCDLDYSPENYKTILFFVENHPPEQKIKKLKTIKKRYRKQAIDVFITILNLHENHGNGVEEEVEKLLIKTGKSVVPKVIFLMHNASSTCTVTKAASMLAKLKDPRGWQPMIDYLPKMENIPSTLIPPLVPEQIIKFDKQEGLTALLAWIKERFDEYENISGNPLDGFGGALASMTIYSPLSTYRKEEIRKAAVDLKYTDEQIEHLLAKIFKEN